MSNYVQKFYEELFLFSLENAYDSGLISHDENFLTYIKSKQDISNFYVMNLSVLADSFEDIHYDMNDVYLSNKVDYALGSDLDEIGRIIGCTRPQATRASVVLTFRTGSYDTVKTIPAGILVSNNAGVTYSTVKDTELPTGATEVDVYALAVEPGIGSRVLAGTLNSILSDVSEESMGVALNSVTNKSSSSGGEDTYDDESYRELILEWRNENIRGSKEAYHKFFSNYDGVTSYTLIPNWNGVSGTLKIVVDPGDPEQLNDIYTQLCENVTQLPEDITLFAPEAVPIDIYAVCNVDIDVINPYSSVEKDSIKSRIEDAVKLYVDGNVTDFTGLKIGEDFIPYQLGVFISKLVPELKDITFKYPRNTDGEVVPITITDEQKAVSHDVKIEIL